MSVDGGKGGRGEDGRGREGLIVLMVWLHINRISIREARGDDILPPSFLDTVMGVDVTMTKSRPS